MIDPEGWTQTRLKHLVDCNVAVLPEESDPQLSFRYIDISAVGQGSIAIPDEPIVFGNAPSRARRRADPGDTVISTVRTYLKAVAEVPRHDELLVFSTGFAVLHPLPHVWPRFLTYLLQNDTFVDRVVASSVGVSYPAIAPTELLRLPTSVPSFEHQHTVARWLDRQTAKVDDLIRGQEILIAMLTERAKALVSRATWQGVDGAECGASDIDTAPLAPAHWCRARNKELLFETMEVSSTGEELMLSVSHLTGITPRSEKNVNMFEAESTVGYRLVSPGDLVINTMWAWMGALGVSRYSGIVSPAYGVYRFRRSEEVEPRYFDYLYRTHEYVVEMTRHSRGVWTSRLRLYPDVFLRLRTVVPPLEEQRRIVAYLDEQTARIDTLITKAAEFIKSARERRAALITAAVTGQIDVREHTGLEGVA